MPVYAYIGKSRLGETFKGEVVAIDSKEAVRILRERQVAVTRLREKTTKVRSQRPWSFEAFKSRVKNRDVIMMTLQCATMLKSGIPLLQCLDILSTHSESRILPNILTEVHRDVESGLTFAEALGRHPKVFTRFYVNMVEVGEATGKLDTMLSRLGDHMERIAAVKGRIFSALAYPITLFILACMVLIFMLVWIVPLFSHMFAEFDQALPWLTLIVLDCGIFIETHLVSVTVGLLIVAVVMRQLYRKERYRKVFDGLMLTVPVLGDVLKKSAIVQFTRTLGTLVSSGVSILDGLVIAGKVSGNTVIEHSIQHVHHQVREGSTISEPLAQSRIFPRLVTQMIAIGESTGSLDAMLGKIADLYEQEVERAVSILTSLFEPMVIVLIGLGIGLIVIAMYLPIFTMGSLIG
jgi:type IV pilus assembly protein PilC